MSFETYLTQKGFELDALTPQQLDSLESAWRREHNQPKPTPTPTPAPVTDFESVMAGLRADNAQGKKIAALVQAAGKDHPNQLDEIEAIGRAALGGNWNETQVELALLRACRPSAPSPLSRNGRDASAAVIECALARTAMDGDALQRHYDAKTLEQADKQFKGGLSITELLLSFARRNGYADASVRGNLAATIQSAMLEPRADIGPSTYNLSGILSNITNKGLRDDFNAVEQSWREVTAFGNLRDFKEVKTYNLVGDLDFKEIPRGGQLEHGTLEEIEYANQLKQHGRLLAIDRPDLINDDLSAFTQARRRLARGAATKLVKIFWTEWNRIAGFNTAGNGTLLSGAGSAFNEAGLDAAYQAFVAIIGPDGEPTGISPRILVVPPMHFIAATRLMTSTTAAAGGLEGDSNPWAGLFQVVTSMYMPSTTLGGVATQWHLIASPAELPVIETAFLNGVEVPTVNDFQMAPDRLGVITQAFLDFGVRRQEYRARVVSVGA